MLKINFIDTMCEFQHTDDTKSLYTTNIWRHVTRLYIIDYYFKIIYFIYNNNISSLKIYLTKINSHKILYLQFNQLFLFHTVKIILYGQFNQLFLSPLNISLESFTLFNLTRYYYSIFWSLHCYIIKIMSCLIIVVDL